VTDDRREVGGGGRTQPVDPDTGRLAASQVVVAEVGVKFGQVQRAWVFASPRAPGSDTTGSRG
jgi:hypothetical protein